MKLLLAELLDNQSGRVVRQRALLQLGAIALSLQFLHLALAWLAVPSLKGLPVWAAWALSGFFGLVLLGLLVFRLRRAVRQPHLEVVRQAFLDAFWLGVAGLAAIFAGRMDFGLGVVGFLTLGLVGYGIGFGRLWLRLSKT